VLAHLADRSALTTSLRKDCRLFPPSTGSIIMKTVAFPISYCPIAQLLLSTFPGRFSSGRDPYPARQGVCSTCCATTETMPGVWGSVCRPSGVFLIVLVAYFLQLQRPQHIVACKLLCVAWAYFQRSRLPLFTERPREPAISPALSVSFLCEFSRIGISRSSLSENTPSRQLGE
jgi:hypothetical protein